MTNQQELHQNLVALFKRYLANEAGLVTAVLQFGASFQTSADQWHFSLPDLHRFCCLHSPELATLSYTQFRQLLYRFPTNQAISAEGGEFALSSNLGHIDQNIYRLKRT